MSTPPGAATPAKHDNIFTRKIGPLPMWAWLAISTALLLGWAYYKNKTNPSSSPTNTANASQVPQFVNQTYTTVTPPGSPPMPPPPAPKPKGDNDDEQDEDERKHKKHHRGRHHPTHHDGGDDSNAAHGGSLPGQQFTPAPPAQPGPRPGPPTWGS